MSSKLQLDVTTVRGGAIWWTRTKAKGRHSVVCRLNCVRWGRDTCHLGHYINSRTFTFTYSSQIDHKFNTLTFITVTNSIKIDVVTFVAEEQKTEPRIEGINWHNKKDAYNPPLLIGTSIVSQLQIDLNTCTDYKWSQFHATTGRRMRKLLNRQMLNWKVLSTT